MRFVYISNPVGAPQVAVFRPRLGIRVLSVKCFVPVGDATAFITFNSDQLNDAFDIFPNTPPFSVVDALAVRTGELYYVCVEVPAGAPIYLTVPANGNIQFIYELT